MKEHYVELLKILKTRFEKNLSRHKNIEWIRVQTKLENNPQKLQVLHDMESTGGEPDIVAYDSKADEYTFCDCATESPKGRRSLCYDNEALASRKEFKPKNSAVGLAKELGIELLTEAEYRDLQKIETFDQKSSSWIKTPSAVRKLGGAIFADRRYDSVFVYHNSAESYYAVRGFRGVLKV